MAQIAELGPWSGAYGLKSEVQVHPYAAECVGPVFII